MKLPKLEIKYGKLLDPFFIAHSQLKYPDWVPPARDEVEKKVLLFKKAWEDEGKGIVEHICDSLGFSFGRNIIDVYIVSGTTRDMSDPIVIRSRYEVDEFIDMLLHELLHRLLTINGSKTDSRFANEHRSTRNHINVFAILSYIYVDFLKDTERLERVVKTATSKEYERAWDIVKEEGYKKLIDECKTKGRLRG